MGSSPLTKFILATMLTVSVGVNAYADEQTVQSLSQGACWVEEGEESIRIASFNDRESINASREDLGEQVFDLLASKNKINPRAGADLNLHCGGYGASLVVKSEVDGNPVCLWLKLNKGKLAVRSIGGLEDSKDDVCDGYKWEELIVGIKTPAQKALLESEQFKSMIKSVVVVSGSTLKVVLTSEYHGKEMDALDILKKASDFKYIELNLYQHPVGEALSLK